MSYSEFISSKLSRPVPTGIQDISELPGLFDFQRDLVTWALRRGRSAIFADTGLGKSRMQVRWADVVSQRGPVLILAPLAVAPQTVEEGRNIGVRVSHVRSGEEIDSEHGVWITNYDRLHLFDPGMFAGVVLDESSVIKHHDAKSFRALTDAFARTPFRLCATATPSPNDYTELGTHAEFLGVCTRAEMLSEFFVHDGGETATWRLKGHARTEFWKFVASWGALVRSPEDLGYEGSSYRLPPLVREVRTIAADHTTVASAGMLFAMEANTLSERRDARRASLHQRVTECSALVNSDSDHWIVWCELNDESTALAKAINGAVEVRGSDSTESKESRLESFANGTTRVLVSKPSICGWGLNWQHCRNIAFVGVSDSYESYYQAVRRCWRFGQKREVRVFLFASELESRVVRNLGRKAEIATAMGEELARETSVFVRAEVRGQQRVTREYVTTKKMEVPSWLTSE